jgi:hypothetical protein
MPRLTAILTRMNAGYADRLGCRADEWLEARLALFEKVCLPSVMAQTDRNFKWLLLCDPLTPLWARGALARAQEICPQIEICYTAHKWGCAAYQSAPERAAVGAAADCLMAFRLDSDDAVSNRLVETLNAQACELAWYEFSKGYLFQAGKAQELDWPSSGFLAVQSKAPDFISPLCFDHSKADEALEGIVGHPVPKRAMDARRAWIHFRHSYNDSANRNSAWTFGAKAELKRLRQAGFPWLSWEDAA